MMDRVNQRLYKPRMPLKHYKQNNASMANMLPFVDFLRTDANAAENGSVVVPNLGRILPRLNQGIVN